MADDKTKLEDDGLDLDLDLDSLDLDDFDPNEKDTRRPATKITSGFIGGVKDLASDANFLKNKALRALPAEYSMASDAVDSAAEAGKTLYDTALTEASKSARDARRLGRRVLPRVARYLPDSIGDKVDKYLKDKEAEDAEARKSSREPTPEEQMASGLNDVFRTSLEYNKERDQENRSKEVLRERLEGQRHTDISRLQESTAIAVNRLVTYQDTITQRYQRKSLELSYRQFFTMRDLLENFKGYAADSLGAFAKITRNTALPEASKIYMSELGKQRIKAAIVESAHERMMNYTRQFRENLMKRLQDQVKGVGEGFRNALDMGNEMLGDDGGDDDLGIDKYVTGGNVLGHIAGDWVGNVVARRVHPYLEKNKRIRDGADKLAYRLDNAPEIIKEWMDRGYEEAPELAYSEDGSRVIGYYDDEGNVVERDFYGRTRDTLQRWGTNFIRDSAPRHTRAMVNENLIDRGEDQAVFNKQTRKTINEVIPGYLSRIHHELNIIRTGDDTVQRTVYDYNDQAFVSTDALRRRVRQAVHPESQLNSVNSILSEFINQLQETGTELSKVAEESLKRHLLSLAESGKRFNPTLYAKPDFVVDADADESVNEEIKAAISKGLLDDKGQVINLKARKELSRIFKSARSSMPNIEQNIIDQSRLGNTEALRDLGFLNYASSGSKARGRSPTADALRKRPHFSKRTKERIWHVSQIDGDVIDARGRVIYRPPAKEIRPREVMSADNVLSSMLSYGTGEDAPVSNLVKGSVQPIARTASGVTEGISSDLSGVETRLDLISNGIDTFRNDVNTYFNRRELAEHAPPPSEKRKKAGDIESLNSGHLEHQTYLLQQSAFRASSKEPAMAAVERLDEILAILRSGIALSGGGDGKGRRSRSRGILGGLSSGIGAGISGVGKFYGRTFSGLGSLFGGGLSGAGNVLRGIGQRFLPGGRKGGGDYDDVTDIYVQGRDSPALRAWKIKAGHYVDKVTGKAITSLKELRKIKGPVIDISRNNETVIDVEDIARGIYAKGKPLVQRGVSFLKSYYQSVFGLAYKPLAAVTKAGSDFIAEGWGRLKGIKDIYVGGEEDPRIKANLLVRGMYYSGKTGKPVRTMREILNAGQIVDSAGRVVLDTADMIKGLKDRRGKAIKGLTERAWDLIGTATGKIKDVISGSWKLAGKAISSMVGAGKGIFDRLTGRARASGDGGSKSSKRVVDVLKDIYSLLDERMARPARGPAHDSDGDGLRDGSWQEQFAARKAKKEERATKEESKEGKSEDKTGSNALTALMDLLKSGGKGLATLFGGKMALDTAGDLLGGEGGGKGKKGRKGKKGLRGKGVKAAGRRGLIGRAAGAVLPALLPLAKGALVGTAKGGLLLLKGAAAIVSAPVLLKVAAVAAVAAGGYFLYRKLSDYKPGDLGKLRFAQYGINPETSKQKYMKKLRWLEQQLEGKVKFSGGEASLNVTSDEEFLNLAKGFGVRDNDDEHLLRWASWFRDRFRPVFLRHCAVTKDLGGSTNLKDVDKAIKKDQQLEYIRRIQFDRTESGSVYGATTTPFSDMSLSMGTIDVLKYIEGAQRKLAEKLGVKGKPEVPGEESSKDDSKVVPGVTIGAGSQMAGMVPRNSGEAPQDYLNNKDGQWSKSDTPAVVSDTTTASQLDKASNKSLLSPIGMGGGYGGSMTGDPADRTYVAPILNQSLDDEVKSTEYARARREAIEQNARAVEVQNRRANDVLSRDMGNVLNVLRRSYDTQRSIDGTLKNINRSIEQMRSDSKRKEGREKAEALLEQGQSNRGFSFFGNSSKPDKPALVNLQKEV